MASPAREGHILYVHVRTSRGGGERRCVPHLTSPEGTVHSLKEAIQLKSRALRILGAAQSLSALCLVFKDHSTVDLADNEGLSLVRSIIENTSGPQWQKLGPAAWPQIEALVRTDGNRVLEEAALKEERLEHDPKRVKTKHMSDLIIKEGLPLCPETPDQQGLAQSYTTKRGRKTSTTNFKFSGDPNYNFSHDRSKVESPTITKSEAPSISKLPSPDKPAKPPVQSIPLVANAVKAIPPVANATKPNPPVTNDVRISPPITNGVRFPRPGSKDPEPPPLEAPTGIAGANFEALPPPLKRCLHCASVKTPQWRGGPLGAKTLCNACGVRYTAGKLVADYRPAGSPGFAEGNGNKSSYGKAPLPCPPIPRKRIISPRLERGEPGR